MSPVYTHNGVTPKIDHTVFIAPTAAVVGDVTIGKNSSIWYGTVVRGDFQPITIGKCTNIQDNATIHVMGDSPTQIGNNVTIGHNVILHCSYVGDNCLIGMGSLLLGYSEIGANSIIGAGTVITQHKKIPPNSLVYGNPAKIIRKLRDDELEAIIESAQHYADEAQIYLTETIERLGISVNFPKPTLA